MDFLKGAESPSSEALLPVVAGEKTASGTESTDNRQRPVPSNKMAYARRTIVVLFLCMLVLLGVASGSGMPCHKAATNQQQEAVKASESSSFSTMLKSASPASLHDLLHRFLPDRFKDGVFPSDHQAMEAVHREDATLASSILQLAKRQDSNSTTSSDSEPSTPTPTVTETKTSDPPIVTTTSTTSARPPTSTSTSVEPTSSSSVPPDTSSSSTRSSTSSSSELPGTSSSSSETSFSSTSTSSSEPGTSSSLPGTSSSSSETTFSSTSRSSSEPGTSSSLPGTSLSSSETTFSSTSSSSEPGTSSSEPQTLPSSSIPGDTTLTTSTVDRPTTTTPPPSSTSKEVTTTFTTTSADGAVVTVTAVTWVPVKPNETTAPATTHPAPELQNLAIRGGSSGSILTGAAGLAMMLLMA